MFLNSDNGIKTPGWLNKSQEEILLATKVRQKESDWSKNNQEQIWLNEEASRVTLSGLRASEK